MGIRSTVGSMLESTIGRERTNTIRKAERKARNTLAKRLATEPPKRPAAKPAVKKTAPKPPPSPAKRPGWQPSDPFAPHPEPRMSRHEFLEGLHEKTRPRTYLEIGIRTGTSLALSRSRSIAVDPRFAIDKPIHCDVQVVKSTSDDFFAGDAPLAHFDGLPVDLAFIDGMHLSEFALRDFINIEPWMADTGVVVFDDVLPRNALEAARDRKTESWAGDVYKVVEILRRRRPDLVVLLLNTANTGTAVVLGFDQASTVLKDCFAEEKDYLLRPDPQTLPQEYLDRSIAVEPDILLESPVWQQLVACRVSAASAELSMLWDELRKLESDQQSQASNVH
ncbi:MAG TPA: class I SAM-dependent methyltransferase [Propionibacteriaceae bacterium]|nr:class I SAM-dependent methyltransferase [Propionibacteriaceae bacterium]